MYILAILPYLLPFIYIYIHIVQVSLGSKQKSTRLSLKIETAHLAQVQQALHDGSANGKMAPKKGRLTGQKFQYKFSVWCSCTMGEYIRFTVL